jgi:hypothetical protein
MPLPKYVACVDAETFYDDVYSLSNLSTTDYIRDPQFELQTCAIKVFPIDDDPDGYAADTYAGYDDTYRALHDIDWSVTAFAGHHTQFDGLIASHHFHIKPALWIDTMSMARQVLGVHQGVSLVAVCERFGRQAKVHGAALKAVKGTRLADMSDALLTELARYNEDDCNDTAFIFRKMRPFVHDDAMRVIDLTMRMYCEPSLLIDGERVARVLSEEKERKRVLYDRLGVDVSSLRKNTVFAEALRQVGVEPPKKISVKQNKEIYAFAKSDYAFKSLLEHEDEQVCWLAEARMASMSNLVQTRSESIMRRVGLPTPIYLNYYAALTGRWTGGDKVNWQNLPRKGLGAELRKSLVAPDKHMIVVSDASQIEARLIAWFSGQDSITQAFARGEDVYCINASAIYGRTITKEDKDERFVGKVFTLGGGFGAGGSKVNYMLKIGQFGPPVLQPMEETDKNVMAWRASVPFIVKKWYRLRDEATTAFMNLTQVEDGPICFEGTRRGGYIHLPDGTYIFYPNVHWDEDENQMCYVGRYGKVRMWHGLITENIIQALARCILAKQMLIISDEMPDLRIASTVHDELLNVVPERKAEDYAKRIHQIKSTPPKWAEGLPLNAEVSISRIYEKT